MTAYATLTWYFIIIGVDGYILTGTECVSSAAVDVLYILYEQFYSTLSHSLSSVAVYSLILDLMAKTVIVLVCILMQPSTTVASVYSISIANSVDHFTLS